MKDFLAWVGVLSLIRALMAGSCIGLSRYVESAQKEADKRNAAEEPVEVKYYSEYNSRLEYKWRGRVYSQYVARPKAGWVPQRGELVRFRWAWNKLETPDLELVE